KNYSMTPRVFKRTVFMIGMLIIIVTHSGCKKDACEECITHSPVANAGNNTIVVLPDNVVNLNGSLSFDPDNNITGYLWTKISGPSSFNITDANAVQTPVINLVQGVYLFELKVTDADALFDRDTMMVTVMAVNQPPSYTN